MNLTPIKNIQGTELYSPLATQEVMTQGVVTGLARLGFFLQTADVQWDGHASDAVFVYTNDWRAPIGALLEISGTVLDYVKHDAAKPVTQIHLDQVRVLKPEGPIIEAIELNARLLADDNAALTKQLNSLEAMLMKIPAGCRFIAPSNTHGDYVVSLTEEKFTAQHRTTTHGGLIIDIDNPLEWLPGFRISNYNKTPRLNVGSKLLNDVFGPLNYRADAYQLAVDQDIKIDLNYISLEKSTLKSEPGHVTVLTLNCFNLDPHVESEHRVMDPRQDVDDDWGEGRFHTLAQAVVLQANLPDIIALQEIQDNDGAELSDVVDASKTYDLLIETIAELSGVHYAWTEVAPQAGMDGGQPGGNIRNAYMYNPQRIRLQPNSTRVFGADLACFEDSRKPLLAVFEEKESGKQVACINVHLASKRHQRCIFSPEDAGLDPKELIRIQQAERVHQQMQAMHEESMAYYVTGDFNDSEFSATLAALTGDDNVNLLYSLAEIERYDYNHRGKLQVLMHGIVHKEMAKTAEYEIIHGNELIGVQPGEENDKPSDHAYVIAKLKL